MTQIKGGIITPNTSHVYATELIIDLFLTYLGVRPTVVNNKDRIIIIRSSFIEILFFINVSSV